MFNMVGRPVGVTKGKVAESRAAVLTASSAQYWSVKFVSPISACRIGTRGNGQPLPSLYDGRIEY